MNFIKFGALLVQVCACCAFGVVHYVIWGRHQLCPSSLLVPDGVLEKFCKVWVLAWAVRVLEEGLAMF